MTQNLVNTEELFHTIKSHLQKKNCMSVTDRDYNASA